VFVFIMSFGVAVDDDDLSGLDVKVFHLKVTCSF
jgi:hypothetical protein